MSDLIRREALMLEVIGLTIVSPEVMNYANAVAVAIENAPSVDAEPVRNGQWENYPNHIYRRCSLCKVEWEKARFNIRANYCPNCGAKMDGGAEDN